MIARNIPHSATPVQAEMAGGVAGGVLAVMLSGHERDPMLYNPPVDGEFASTVRASFQLRPNGN